jgi:hypothetical protein
MTICYGNLKYDVSDSWCNDKKEMGRNVFGSEIEDSKLQQRDNGRLGITWLKGFNGVATHT